MSLRPIRRRRQLLKIGLGACCLGVARHAVAQAVAEGSMPLQLLRTGDIGALPWVEFELGGSASRWLLDSGATAAVISPALASRLQLAKASSVRVVTAGGTQTLDRYTLPPLPVFGGAGPRAAGAIALDLQQLLGAAGGLLDGVIGAPWLRDAVTTFDFARGRLQWTRAAGPPSAAASVLPLRWVAGLPTLSFAIGQRAAEPFLLDTGNAGALVVFAQRAQALLADAGALPETTVRELGGAVRAHYARIDRLTAAGLVARQVPAALEAGSTARRGGHFDRLAGSIGVALFESGAVTLDGPGERLIIEQPGLPEPPPLPGGFGFRLGRDGGDLRVDAVIDGGPAAAAGVAAGDSLATLDEIDVRQWPPQQIWQALAGRDQASFGFRRGESPTQRRELRRARFFPLLQ